MSGTVVAIIDDNAGILDIMKFALETFEYKVLAYPMSTLFLEDVRARPACLIVDQNMDGLTGLELVAHLRQAGNHIPVALTTGLLSTDVAARAAQLEVELVLEKPVGLDDLLDFVARHC